MACIYQIKNLVNNKIYIGSTQKENSYARKSEHFSRLKSNTHNNKHLQSSFNKYGEENFLYEILEELTLPVDYIYIMNKELFYINNYNPEYNIARETKGGKLGRIITKEQKEHLSKLFTCRKVSDETKAKIKLARAKQIITEEHKRKISLSTKGVLKNKGRKQSDKQRANISKKVLELNKLGIGFHSEESKKKRTETLKIKFNSKEIKEKLKISARKRCEKPFLCFKNNILIKEFNNQIEASEFLGFKKPWGISSVLNNIQKTHKGYTFIYKNI